jgi:hypothetical protein
MSQINKINQMIIKDINSISKSELNCDNINLQKNINLNKKNINNIYHEYNNEIENNNNGLYHFYNRNKINKFIDKNYYNLIDIKNNYCTMMNNFIHNENMLNKEENILNDNNNKYDYNGEKNSKMNSNTSSNSQSCNLTNDNSVNDSNENENENEDLSNDENNNYDNINNNYFDNLNLNKNDFHYRNFLNKDYKESTLNLNNKTSNLNLNLKSINKEINNNKNFNNEYFNEISKEDNNNNNNNNSFIKIVIKLSKDRSEVFEIQKGKNILMQINKFCIKNNIDDELIDPIYKYIEQSLKVLGIIFDKKIDNKILKKLKEAKLKFEVSKELEKNYFSDSEILLRYNKRPSNTLN